MIQYEWVNFTISDLSFDEETTYTQDSFEETVNDKFVCVEVEEDGFPKYIWTKRFVFQVLKRYRMMGQLAIAGAPRNPDWKNQ